MRDALLVNEALLGDPLGVLAALGGFELACLAGVVLGCAEERTCVVADGFISGAAALAAVRLCPDARDVLFASHRSVEPGHAVVLDALGLKPVLELDMRLGEGTGAALAMGIMDAACADDLGDVDLRRGRRVDGERIGERVGDEAHA